MYILAFSLWLEVCWIQNNRAEIWISTKCLLHFKGLLYITRIFGLACHRYDMCFMISHISVHLIQSLWKEVKWNVICSSQIFFGARSLFKIILLKSILCWHGLMHHVHRRMIWALQRINECPWFSEKKRLLQEQILYACKLV